jgi:cytochrome c
MIATKYEKDTKAIETLSEKILKGGAGVWGETPMAAHPQLTKDQTMQMVEYILSLAKEKKKESLPVKGSVKFDKPPGQPGTKSAYLLTAIYEDKGAGTIPSLSSEKTIVLTSPILDGADFDELNGPSKFKVPTGSVVLQGVKNGGTAITREVDLTGAGHMTFMAVLVKNVSKNGTIDVYLDSRDGKKLGTANFANTPRIPVADGYDLTMSNVGFPALEGKHKLILVFNNEQAGDGDLFMFSGITLDR